MFLLLIGSDLMFLLQLESFPVVSLAHRVLPDIYLANRVFS
jgi:hypothetical protein